MTRYCPHGHPLEDWMTECPYCPQADDNYRKVLGDSPPATEEADDTLVTPPPELKPTVVDGYTEFFRQPAAKTVADLPRPAAPPGRRVNRKYPLLGWLVIMTGESKWQDFRIDRDSLIIGSGDECDIHLSDPDVARQHARIHRQIDGLLLTDLGSSGGTFVNNDPTPIEHRVLGDEDLIRMGNTYLKFRKL